MISLNFVKPLLAVMLLLLLGSLMGCAGSLDYETLSPRGAGFQANLPLSGTRVVVWGNHSEAVDQASTWFHQHGLVIMDRTRLQQGLNNQKFEIDGVLERLGSYPRGGKSYWSRSRRICRGHKRAFRKKVRTHSGKDGSRFPTQCRGPRSEGSNRRNYF